MNLMEPWAAANGEGLIGSWSPSIGDPTMVGWVTTIAYLVTAWYCRSAARPTTAATEVTATAVRERRLWWTFALVLLLLGINKQLDLQTPLTVVGRFLARGEHWYEQRRQVQFVFIVVVAIAGVLATVVAARAARGASRAARLAVLGAAVLTAFVVLRAASFHHVDMLLESRWVGVVVNAVMELSGITIVLVAAWGRRSTRKSRTSN